MVLAFFLSFLGYILFPDLMTFCVVLIGWSLWFGFSPWIHKNLSKIRSGESARRPFSLSPRWILTIALTALLLVGVLYAALRGTLTISLPVVGQVGDWGFVILLLLTLTDMRDASRIRNLWIPFAFIAAYFLIFFAAGETGGPVVLAIIFLFYVVMRLAALARFPVPALIAAGFVLVFLLAFAFGNFFTYAAPNHKIAKRIVQWAENYQKEDSSEPLQVQRARTLAAAGGWKGFGLYKGLYRIKGEEASTDFVAAVLFEEMGMRNGSLIILLLLLVAYGCYVQGVRNSKMHYAILCYSIAGFIAVRTLVGLASSTGVRLELGWLRLGVPVVGLPLPFLSRGGASEVILFLCLSVMEAAKMMEVSFRQKVMEEEEM
jgi:cell division protein FtsW (lipid II flippase)